MRFYKIFGDFIETNKAFGRLGSHLDLTNAPNDLGSGRSTSAEYALP